MKAAHQLQSSLKDIPYQLQMEYLNGSKNQRKTDSKAQFVTAIAASRFWL